MSAAGFVLRYFGDPAGSSSASGINHHIARRCRCNTLLLSFPDHSFAKAIAKESVDIRNERQRTAMNTSERQ
jgi:hypothetical protein